MKNDTIINIFPEQIRSARGLLGWSQEDLARKIGKVTLSITRLETGKTKAPPKTLQAIKDALESAGVVFINEEGFIGVKVDQHCIKCEEIKD